MPNPDDNVFGIDEPAMAATGMGPTAATAQAPTKDIAAHTDAVVDWVHQQSNHEQLRNAAIVSRRAQMITPPPFDIQGINRRAERERNRLSGTAGRPVKRVYDIATLLKLRETQCAVPVMLRVKPEAIAGRVFLFIFFYL